MVPQKAPRTKPADGPQVSSPSVSAWISIRFRSDGLDTLEWGGIATSCSESEGPVTIQLARLASWQAGKLANAGKSRQTLANAGIVSQKPQQPWLGLELSLTLRRRRRPTPNENRVQPGYNESTAIQTIHTLWAPTWSQTPSKQPSKENLTNHTAEQAWATEPSMLCSGEVDAQQDNGRDPGTSF